MLEGLEERRQVTLVNDTGERGTQTEDGGDQSVKTRETTSQVSREEDLQALQAENEELKKELKRLKGEEETVTGEMLEGQVSYDRFENLNQMCWSKEVFKAAFMARGSMLRGSKDTDFIILEEEERWRSVNQGHRKALHDRFPELQDLEGRLTALMVRTRALEKGATGSERERWVVKAEVDESKREWFNTLTQVRKMMTEGGRNKISSDPPGQDRGDETTRKMMKYIVTWLTSHYSRFYHFLSK